MLGAVGALAVLLALTIVAARILLFEIPERRVELQAWISIATGLDLRLGKLSARWGSGGPEIYATDVQVYAPNGGPRLARAEAIIVRTDLKRMLTRTELLSGHVRLVGPEMRLVRTTKGIELEGQPEFRERPDKGPMNSDALPSGSLQIEDGRITLIDARVETAAQPEPVVKIQGVTLKLQRDGDVVKFDGDLDLPKRLGGGLDFAGSIRGRLDQPKQLVWQASLAGHHLHLDSWREFLSGRYRNLNPRGEINALNVSASGTGFGAPQFKVDARFAGVGIDPVDRIPGVSGLAGEIKATERAGEAQINSQSFVLNIPYSFREPLSANVQGTVNWERVIPAPSAATDEGVQTAALAAASPQPVTAAYLRIASQNFNLITAHGAATGDIELTIPNDGSSRFLKLHAHLKDGVLKEGWRYIPIDRLRNVKTVAWLDKAFLSGRVTSSEVMFEGPTKRFPFRGGEGQFRATAAVEGLDMHYSDGWPAIRGMATDVEFLNYGMSGVLRAGTVNGLQIAPGARAEIADFREAKLTVKGQASGDLNAALGYLQATPLGKGFGAIFMDLRGSGPVSARLDLMLPFKQFDQRSVNVVADFGAAGARNRLSLQNTNHELRDLRGKLRVQDKQLSATALKASYLGGPVVIDLKPQVDRRNDRVSNNVNVRGQTSAPALAQAFKLPAKIELSGTLDWRATARIAPDPRVAKTPRKTPGRNVITAQVDSDLQGVGIGLPAPLAKVAGEPRPLRVELSWPLPDSTEVRASYGDLLQANLNFAKEASAVTDVPTPLLNKQPVASGGEWRFVRGAARLGGGAARALTGSGMIIDGNVDTLDLSGWLSMRSDGGSSKRKLSDYLRNIDLQVRDLQLYSFHLPDVSAQLVAGAQAWSVTVDGPRSRGTVLVPFDLGPAQTLSINMTRLDLGESKPASGAGGTSSADPSRWPAVKVSVREFSALNKKLGFLRAQLTPVPNGLSLQSLSATGSTFQITGTGSWTGVDANQRSQIALRLESKDVLQTLQDLGYGAAVAGERALAVMDLNWPGAPDGTLLSRLSGTMSLEVDKGRLVSVQPGAGRVFGLMSLTTLRRRMALDFSDLTDKGLAFDAIRGDFTLRTGDAYTSNLLLRGPAAEIGIVGRTGLDTKDYDQTAVVTGNLGQSLPVAGALAGGPAVGAALLVFTQIFKQPLKGIARGYYRITGPWEDPTVQRVEADEVKKAAEAARVREQRAGAG